MVKVLKNPMFAEALSSLPCPLDSCLRLKQIWYCHFVIFIPSSVRLWRTDENVARDGVCWGVRGREWARCRKTCFSAVRWYTFIISRTFARGRYSLIVYCFPTGTASQRNESRYYNYITWSTIYLHRNTSTKYQLILRTL